MGRERNKEDSVVYRQKGPRNRFGKCQTSAGSWQMQSVGIQRENIWKEQQCSYRLQELLEKKNCNTCEAGITQATRIETRLCPEATKESENLRPRRKVWECMCWKRELWLNSLNEIFAKDKPGWSDILSKGFQLSNFLGCSLQLESVEKKTGAKSEPGWDEDSEELG